MKSTLSFGLVSILLSATSSVGAVEVYSSGAVSASLVGGVRGGYQVANALDEFGHGPTLTLARLGASFEFGDVGAAQLVVDGVRGNATLLDARGDVRLSECLTWRFGRYKVPMSPDFLVAAYPYFWSSRMLLGSLVPRRLDGTSLAYRNRAGSAIGVNAEAGVFQVAGDSGPLEDDLWVGGRVAVAPVSGLELHLGAGAQVERSNDENTFGRAVDVGVTYRDHGVEVGVESAVRLDELEDDQVRAWGVGMTGAYAIVTSAPFDVVPQVGADTFRSAADASTHRGRAGVLLRWREAPVSIGLETEVSSTEGELAERGFLYGQVKL